MMKRIFSILLAISLYSCSNNDKSFSIIKISLITCEKTLKIDGSILNDSSQINIIYIDDFVIYELPKIVYKNNITTIVGDTIKTMFINPDTTFKYFLIKKDEKMGLNYENISAGVAKRFSLDSLLIENGLHSSMKGVYNLQLGKPNQIISKGNNIRVEKYLNKKTVPQDPDSIYRYFDKKLIAIDFSFSPLLDKEKNSKLVKTSFINIYDRKERKDSVIRSEFYSEMKEIKIDKPADFILLIKRYENDAKRMNLK